MLKSFVWLRSCKLLKVISHIFSKKADSLILIPLLLIKVFPEEEGSKLAPDRRGNSVVTEVDYRTGVGKNLAKGSISDSSPTVNSRDSILFYAR